MRATAVVVSCLVVALVGCGPGEPEQLTDVIQITSVEREATLRTAVFLEDAVTLDTCVLSEPGVVTLAGTVDLGPTGVTDDGPVDVEVVVGVALGGTLVDAALVGTLAGTGTFDLTYPLEEVHGEEAATVVESRIDDEQFPAQCRAEVVTTRVRFLPAPDVPLVPAPGVTPRTLD